MATRLSGENNPICFTCGAEFLEKEPLPSICTICDDPRQYVGWNGQEWTTRAKLAAEGYRIVLAEEEPGLYGIGVEPKLGIGQRALLIQPESGRNILWDCVSHIDDDAIAGVRALGGIDAIACSHPHFYGVMARWSEAFNHAPVYVPEDDIQFLTNPEANIVQWSGSVDLASDIKLIQCGGHFDGSAVIHWKGGREGSGALLVGDTLYVVKDRRYVSFMRSIPNMIPLGGEAVDRITSALEGCTFSRIYSAWWDRISTDDGPLIVEKSAERHCNAVKGVYE